MHKLSARFIGSALIVSGFGLLASCGTAGFGSTSDARSKPGSEQGGSRIPSESESQKNSGRAATQTAADTAARGKNNPGEEGVRGGAGSEGDD